MVTTRSGLVIGLAITALLGASACGGGPGVAASPQQGRLASAHKEMPGTYIPPKNAPIASKTPPRPLVIPSDPPFVVPLPGIEDEHSGPFAAMDFTVENRWQGYVGSTWTLVYAGSDRRNDTAPPGGGIPAVRLGTATFNASGMTSASNLTEFRDPSASGPLIITSVSGTIMTFTTASGGSAHFNLRSPTPSGEQVHFNLLTHTFS